MDQVISTPILAPLPSALQPLHGQQPQSLPTEILIKVFLLCLPPLNFAQAPQKTTLALVCRFWNAVLDSTPVLWSGVSIADSIIYVQRSLLKSGECPIDVYGDRPAREGYWGGLFRRLRCDSVGCNFLTAVGSHAQRWRHVTLHTWCDQKFTPSVTTFPSLLSLELHSGGEEPSDDEYLPLLNGANTPHLRELLLRAPQISRWNLISFPSSLSKLEIRDLGAPRPSANTLLSILSTCPNLTVLRLCYFSCWGLDPPDDVDGKAPAVVELSALQELELNVIQHPHIHGLLERLRIPEECIVSLTSRRAGNNSSPSKYFLTPTFSQRQGSFQTAKVTLAFAPYTFHLLAVSERWRMVLDLGEKADTIRDTLRWFDIGTEDCRTSYYRSDTSQSGSTISNSGAITLKLRKEGNKPTVSSRDLAPVSDLQCINRIEVNRLPALELVFLFWHLSQPEHSDQPSKAMDNYDPEQPGSKKQTAMTWPFPCVSELVLEEINSKAMRGLVDAIRSRSGDGATAGAPGMPARFKRIEFMDDEEPSWREEKDHVADAHEVERLLLEILDVLDDDAELIWKGKRISKA